jgi:D-glycero-D-manno-heptose 1,7-bisphosphate phosphatase
MSLIILDRDGVINQFSGEVIQTPADWVPIEGSLEAIARLNQENYRVIVITNQSGISQGDFDVETLTKIHSKMRRMLSQVGGKIEAVLFCPHQVEEDCSCWLSEGGPLSEISNRLRINLSNVPVVSPRLANLNSAQTVGARPILVNTKHNEEHSDALLKGIEFYDDLSAVTAALLDTES